MRHGANPTYDVLGIGVGPFNLGLACLTEPIDELEGVFLERKPAFDWHPGLLLDASTLQTPFLADLVTLADPTSPFSFLSYLKEVGRLYAFYIRESFHPFRSEYEEYCRWAADKLDSVRFGREVDGIEYDADDETYTVLAVSTATGEREAYRARSLVLGTGTPPHVPPACRGLPDDAVHSSGYLDAKPGLQERGSIAVVGSGQSAAEIFHDLLADSERHEYELTWITRSPRFFPLEYTKLTLELTSPEYADYFHALPEPTREAVLSSQASLYRGIDTSLIDAIYDLLYRRKVQGRPPPRMLPNTELTRAGFEAVDGEYVLELRQVEQGRDLEVRAEGLVLATGYRYEVPAFLSPIADRIAWDEHGRLAVRRNYSIDVTGRGIFVQNAELHTHGFVAPDLGMAAYRNSYIIRELLGREHYPIERSIAFQDFGGPRDVSPGGAGATPGCARWSSRASTRGWAGSKCGRSSPMPTPCSFTAG